MEKIKSCVPPKTNIAMLPQYKTVMEQCWTLNPEDRPKFKQVRYNVYLTRPKFKQVRYNVYLARPKFKQVRYNVYLTRPKFKQCLSDEKIN